MRRFALDKQAHFWAGLGIAGGLVAYGFDPFPAFGAAMALAALKEAVDPKVGGQRDVMDFAATALGAAIILPLVFI
jgi:hypothetical protein